MTPALSQKLLAKVTRGIFNELYNGKYEVHNQCLRWAGLTSFVYQGLQLYDFMPKGRAPLIQAGTAQWRYREGDDMTEDTFFGYYFSKQELMRHLLLGPAGGTNMEWHVWVAIPSTKEIIDLTTGYQAKQLFDTAVNLPKGTEWNPAFSLPDFLWMDAEAAFDKGWQYLPDIDACLSARDTFAHALTVHDLVTKSSLSHLFKKHLQLSLYSL